MGERRRERLFYNLHNSTAFRWKGRVQAGFSAVPQDRDASLEGGKKSRIVHQDSVRLN